MFNFISDLVEEAVDAAGNIVDQTFDAALEITSLGEGGRLDSTTMANLLASGLTLYEISELSGIAMYLLEDIVDERD